tara:strand:- start:689 stop:1390 length:702 start_codon:yes stop_codon:yes gene_type:complete
MKSHEKRTQRLKQILERLSRGEIVQNRQLKTLLGAEGYARYLDDYCEQTQLRDMLKDKSDEIIEYERRLKAATFAYSKADSKGLRGRPKAGTKMFNDADTLFERLSEYLSEKIAGHLDLETWFDRPLAMGAENSFSLTPSGFPQIITSKSLKNRGGGYLSSKRTIRQVKIDAVNTILEELTAPKQETVVCEIDQMARLKKLMKRSRDQFNSTTQFAFIHINIALCCAEVFGSC